MNDTPKPAWPTNTPPPAPEKPFNGCLACWADRVNTAYYHTCGKPR